MRIMHFEIVKYKESHIQAVREFNRRLREGGSRYQFPESPIPEWLPRIEGRRLFQEFFVALSDNSVHGGYILKHQDFHVAGKDVYLASYQLPLSEATVDKTFRGLGRQLAEDALERQELLYTLGMGGIESPAARSLRKMGWIMHLIPFYFKIVHPFNFLRNIKYLRNSDLKKVLLDILAFSGMGWLGIRILRAARSHNNRPDGEIERVESDVFGEWADVLWQASGDFYVFSAVRDRRTLNILYPTSDHRFVRVLVKNQNRVVGWAVLLATQMSDHNYFGNMKVGTIVDCLALPGFERHVICSAEDSLKGREVDIMVSNQGHAAWARHCKIPGSCRGHPILLWLFHLHSGNCWSRSKRI